MNTKQTLAALSALAQESRLAVFRLLVQAGPDGLAASKIGEVVSVQVIPRPHEDISVVLPSAHRPASAD